MNQVSLLLFSKFCRDFSREKRLTMTIRSLNKGAHEATCAPGCTYNVFEVSYWQLVLLCSLKLFYMRLLGSYGFNCLPSGISRLLRFQTFLSFFGSFLSDVLERASRHTVCPLFVVSSTVASYIARFAHCT